jgi:hypothetical protein
MSLFPQDTCGCRALNHSLRTTSVRQSGSCQYRSVVALRAPASVGANYSDGACGRVVVSVVVVCYHAASRESDY